MGPCDGDIARLAPSQVCDGLGVFASEDVPQGTVVAWYAGRSAGRRLPHRRGGRHAVDYLYECHDGSRIIGDRASVATSKRRRDPSSGRRAPGLAQMANDAVHPELTGRENNCAFSERRVPGGKQPTQVELVTCRDVRAGEELLVPYTLQYWLVRAEEEETRMPSRMRDWLACHSRVQRLLASACAARTTPGAERACRAASVRVEMDHYHGVHPDGVHYSVTLRPPHPPGLARCRCCRSRSRSRSSSEGGEASVSPPGPPSGADDDEEVEEEPTPKGSRATYVLVQWEDERGEEASGGRAVVRCRKCRDVLASGLL